MRTQEEAEEYSMYHAHQLVVGLQDADAPQELIDQAEELQADVGEALADN